MSRINFGAKPWVYPMPVLIIATYDENGVPNAMNADESILTNGMIDMRKLKPIVYDPVGHTYVGMGATVGRAFSDGKKLVE